jgi:hypothetical protein
MACNTLASEELENTINEIDNLLLDEVTEKSTYRIFKSSKDKDAILHNCYYYNWQRENQNGSIVFKCRQKQEELPKQECPGIFTLKTSGTFTVKSHKCVQLVPIQCEIMQINSEIEEEIKKRPTLSIKKLYDEKELELTIKYGAKDVAKYWPQFDSVDSAFFSYKNKLIPA